MNIYDYAGLYNLNLKRSFKYFRDKSLCFCSVELRPEF